LRDGPGGQSDERARFLAGDRGGISLSSSFTPIDPTMKAIAFLLFVALLPFTAFAQEFDPEKTYIVTMSDGTTFVGTIVSSDLREIIIRTADRGEVALPKFSVQSVREVRPGESQTSNLFATRYFITTNGLPVAKGESYIQWTPLGPDVQFGVADNLTVGVITTWFASPILGSMKYSIPLSENTSMAIGALAGTTTWGSFGEFIFALPYAGFTMGNRENNFTLSAGFVSATFGVETMSNPLLSVAFMRRMTPRATFVFDSMVVPDDNNTVAYLIPALRLQTKPNSATQFGFGGIVTRDGSLPFPSISYFHKF